MQMMALFDEFALPLSSFFPAFLSLYRLLRGYCNLRKMFATKRTSDAAIKIVFKKYYCIY